MFCPNCGATINDNSIFCPNCGYQKTNYNNNAKTTSILQHFKIKYVIIAVCLVIAFIFAKFLFTNITNVATHTFASEENKCKKYFVDAMEDLKSGNISSLKEYMVGDSLGSIDDLLLLVNADTNAVKKICSTIFHSYDYKIEDIVHNTDNDGFIIKVKLIVPNGEYINNVSKNILSKFDLTDLGVLFGAKKTKVTKIIDKILEGYKEVSVKDYGTESISFDVEMVNIDGKYKINNLNKFLNSSNIGKFINNIQPVISAINSFFN